MLAHISPNELDALRTVLAVATDEVDRAQAGADITHNYGYFHRARQIVIELVQRWERTP